MSTTPPWRMIYDDIRRQIESGELEPGDQLPSTPHLCRQYAHLVPRGAVSPGTVRRAIQTLQAQEWLTSVPGLGVYVADKPPS